MTKKEETVFFWKITVFSYIKQQTVQRIKSSQGRCVFCGKLFLKKNSVATSMKKEHQICENWNLSLG